MVKVTIDKDRILEAIKAEFDTDAFKAKYAELEQLKKEHNINPFKQTYDGTPEGWEGLKRATQIIAEIVQHGIVTAERVVAEAGEVGRGADKAEALASWLDDVVHVPIFLEPFDKMFFKFLISTAVKGLEIIFGKDWIKKIPVIG